MLHLDYNADLNAETLAGMQASGLLYTYLTDISCTNILVPQLSCTECALERFHLNGLDGKVTVLLKVVIPRETLDDPTLENELVAYKLNLKIANGQHRCFSAVSDYRDEQPDALGVITPGEYRWLALQKTAELYAPIDGDIQWAMQNDQGELDSEKLAAYMDTKVNSQNENFHLNL
ncbi:hypothetical protein PHET_08973 [Paragonimus heterotremus]|uniref:Uncharacterized protein n=1 Tax=Paragonimus heterotremus TaxID=100268 RepID=A0A8J4TBH1_9TREM|nr:hypothetical protein PHET_08973 [Paragonimus heterotremus]